MHDAWDARTGPFARLTLEHLERVAAPEVALAIFERAMWVAGAHAVPEDPELFAAFACGPLFEAISDALGETTAHAVCEDLELVFVHVRARSGAQRRDVVRERIAAAQGRVVILASNDPERCQALSARIALELRVEVATDPFRLVQLTEAHAQSDMLLVVDGGVPGLKGPMIVTLARLLPARASIVFRGRAPEGMQEIPCRFTELSIDASDDELIAICLAPPGPNAGHRPR